MRFLQRLGRRACAGFTLMEVNLAIFIMAVGVLAMASLYPLGYRENQQSQDDVRAAALADLVLCQIRAALSSRNITWNDWVNHVGQAVNATPKGWLNYLDEGKGWAPIRASDMTSKANDVFRALMRTNPDNSSPDDVPQSGNNDLKYALVASWGKRTIAQNGGQNVLNEDDYSRVCVSLRATRRARALFAQPMYYTEIHFQGDQKEMGQ